MDEKRSNVFNAHQGKFGSHWLNVVPCKQGFQIQIPNYLDIGQLIGVQLQTCNYHFEGTQTQHRN